MQDNKGKENHERKKKESLPKLKKKMGRPKIKIDMQQLAAFCRLKPSLQDCAWFFKCSGDIIERNIKSATGLTFSEFRNQNAVYSRFELIRSAMRKAETSDTMHIFCLKNLCDWTDKQKIESEVNGGIVVQLTKEDIDSRIKKIKERE